MGTGNYQYSPTANMDDSPPTPSQWAQTPRGNEQAEMELEIDRYRYGTGTGTVGTVPLNADIENPGPWSRNICPL